MSGEVGTERPRRLPLHTRRSRLRRRRRCRGAAITTVCASRQRLSFSTNPNVASHEASNEVDARPAPSAAHERSSGLALKNPRVFCEAPEDLPRRGCVDGPSDRSLDCTERVLVDTVSFPAKPLYEIMTGFSQSADSVDHHLRPRFAEPYRGDEAVFSQELNRHI
jgi:hypothetical protein